MYVCGEECAVVTSSKPTRNQGYDDTVIRAAEGCLTSLTTRINNG